MFRAVPLPIIRSLFTVHSALVYIIQVCSFRARPGCYCSKAVYKPVWHTPVPNVQWINSWWWAEELRETCRVSGRSKFGKLVHLVGFIIKKIVAELYISVPLHFLIYSLFPQPQIHVTLRSYRNTRHSGFCITYNQALAHATWERSHALHHRAVPSAVVA